MTSQACVEIRQLAKAWVAAHAISRLAQTHSAHVADQAAEAAFTRALAALEAENQRMREALTPINEMPVNNDELVRIRNRAEMSDGGNVKLWGKMLLTLVDTLLAARRAAAIRTQEPQP